jgi:hypothetical protein
VNGGKLVTKEEKEKLDEWYIRNASPWVDLQIVMMTLKLILRTRLSSKETVADVEQVQNRNIEVNATTVATARVADYAGAVARSTPAEKAKLAASA